MSCKLMQIQTYYTYIARYCQFNNDSLISYYVLIYSHRGLDHQNVYFMLS